MFAVKLRYTDGGVELLTFEERAIDACRIKTAINQVITKQAVVIVTKGNVELDDDFLADLCKREKHR